MSIRGFYLLSACLALTVVNLGWTAGHPAVADASPSHGVMTAGPAACSQNKISLTRAQRSASSVPADFKATSATFVSEDETFVLGTAPGYGTLLLRSLDRGRIWVRLAAPSVPLGRPGSSGRAVWGVRFASPAHGFVFGDGLWETSDGGQHWSRDSQPSGSILSLATIDGQVLALTAKGSAQAGLHSGRLLRRSLAGGSWSVLSSVQTLSLSDPTDLISTQAGSAAVLDGASILFTTDGGLRITRLATPLVKQLFRPASVAATSAEGLALLYLGQGYTGHTDKQVYTSTDGGLHWSKAGIPSNEGDYGTLAGSESDLLLATASGASWIDRSADDGCSWTTRLTYDDGGAGWGDLGFTTHTDAVVIHGPADLDGNTDGRAGQLLLSSNGGATWRQVSF